MSQRQPPIYSKALRESARDKLCSLRLPGVCNYDTATTVLAHVYVGPKSMGGKGHDLHAAFACSACHEAIDRYQAHDRYRVLLQGMIETQAQWIADGLLIVPTESAKPRSNKSRNRPAPKRIGKASKTASPSKMLPRI